MTGILTVARREVFSFFVSPVAYVVACVWLVISGATFYVLAAFGASQSVGSGMNLLEVFYGGTFLFWLPLLIFAPVLTMRLLSEERSSGTIESLMTAPVTEVQIVLGKYLAALVFWVVLWLPTLSYVWLAAGTGKDVVDLGTIGATYFGLFCIGAFYMAVGLLMSAVSPNQIVAALLTFLVLGGLFVVGLLSFAALDDEKRAIFEYVGMWTQMSAFAKGIVDTRYVVYDFSLAGLALFLCVGVLQANRWHA
jgi:ABC-2 type transport system permease protein